MVSVRGLNMVRVRGLTSSPNKYLINILIISV